MVTEETTIWNNFLWEKYPKNKWPDKGKKHMEGVGRTET